MFDHTKTLVTNAYRSGYDFVGKKLENQQLYITFTIEIEYS